MNIIKYFPEKIKTVLKPILQKDSGLEEIRFRVNRPLILKYNQIENKLSYIVTAEDILEIVEKVCENSIYSYQKQIINGYITTKGGHRLGIRWECGNRKWKNNKYKIHIKFEF